MPLFGPNIDKMKERGDVAGLTRVVLDGNLNNSIRAAVALADLGTLDSLREALASPNHIQRLRVAQRLKEIGNQAATQLLIDALGSIGEVLESPSRFTRVEAARLLKEIGSQTATQLLTDALKKRLQYGLEAEDRLEVVIIARGWRARNLPFIFTSTENLPEVAGKPLELETAQELLYPLATLEGGGLQVWLACQALVELGDRSDPIIDGLIESASNTLKKLEPRAKDIEKLDESLLHSGLKMNKYVDLSVKLRHLRTFSLKEVKDLMKKLEYYGDVGIIADWVAGEKYLDDTIRALATCRNTQKATDAVIAILEQDSLSALSIPEWMGEQKAICALGALGDANTVERLEFLAKTSGKLSLCAKVALEMFGSASYDDIKARAIF